MSKLLVRVPCLAITPLYLTPTRDVSICLIGPSLTSGSPIGTLASAQLTNGAVINTADLITTNLTMQDSIINGIVAVSGQTTGSGSADVSNSTIQRLAVGGFFD